MWLFINHMIGHFSTVTTDEMPSTTGHTPPEPLQPQSPQEGLRPPWDWDKMRRSRARRAALRMYRPPPFEPILH